jgi:hypothetical protein
MAKRSSRDAEHYALSFELLGDCLELLSEPDQSVGKHVIARFHGETACANRLKEQKFGLNRQISGTRWIAVHSDALHARKGGSSSRILPPLWSRTQVKPLSRTHTIHRTADWGGDRKDRAEERARFLVCVARWRCGGVLLLCCDSSPLHWRSWFPGARSFRR